MCVLVEARGEHPQKSFRCFGGLRPIRRNLSRRPAQKHVSNCLFEMRRPQRRSEPIHLFPECGSAPKVSAFEPRARRQVGMPEEQSDERL